MNKSGTTTTNQYTEKLPIRNAQALVEREKAFSAQLRACQQQIEVLSRRIIELEHDAMLVEQKYAAERIVLEERLQASEANAEKTARDYSDEVCNLRNQLLANQRETQAALNQLPALEQINAEHEKALRREFALRDESLRNEQNQQFQSLPKQFSLHTDLENITSAKSLDELISKYDEQFVHCAFLTLLGRAPDPEGFGYYLGRLRAGFAKMGIVTQIYSSIEGKAYSARLPGLDSALKRHQRGQYYLVGWLFRRLNGLESNRPDERKLNRMENQLFQSQDKVAQGFSQVKSSLAGIYNIIGQQTQLISSMGQPKTFLTEEREQKSNLLTIEDLIKISST